GSDIGIHPSTTCLPARLRLPLTVPSHARCDTSTSTRRHPARRCEKNFPRLPPTPICNDGREPALRPGARRRHPRRLRALPCRPGKTPGGPNATHKLPHPRRGKSLQRASARLKPLHALPAQRLPGLCKPSLSPRAPGRAPALARSGRPPAPVRGTATARHAFGPAPCATGLALARNLKAAGWPPSVAAAPGAARAKAAVPRLARLHFSSSEAHTEDEEGP